MAAGLGICLRQSKFLRYDLPALLIYLAVATALFAPALNFDQVHLFGTDTVTQKYLFYQTGFDYLRATGRLPFWNPYVHCGVPFLGSFALCPFFPTTWLMALAPFALGFALHYLLSNFLAGALGYAGLGLMGRRRFAAFAGGLLWQLNCHFCTLVYPGHIGKYPAIACAPLVIGGVVHACRTKHWRGFILAGVGLALQIFASHVQIAYYIIGLCIAYAVAHALWAAPRQPREWLRRIAGLALMLGVGASLSAVFLFPALETSVRSGRAGGVEFEEATKSSYPPDELWELILPLYTGHNVHAPGDEEEPPRYFGQWGERLVSDYVGMGVLLFALLGLLLERRMERWFWLAVIGTTLLMCVGKYHPLYHILYDWIPGLDHFRSPATIMFLIPLALAGLVSMGVERLLDAGDLSGRRKIFWIISGTSIWIFLILFLAGYLRLCILPDEAMREFYFFNAMARTGMAGLACGVTMILIAVLFSGMRERLMALALFVTIAALDLWSVDRIFVRTAPLKDLQAMPARYAPLRDAMRMRLRSGPQDRVLIAGGELSNWLMMSGIRSLHGYHPVVMQRCSRLLDAGGGSYGPRASRLLNLRFVVGDPGTPGFAQEFRPVAGIKGLYEHREPLQYAWFPERLTPAQDDEDWLRQTAALDDCYAAAITALETNEAEFGAAQDCAVRLLNFQPDEISLRVKADKPRPLVLSELYMPGWQCRLEDGAALPIECADYALRMIRVPAGMHQLTMQYAPDSYRTGGFLSLATLAMLFAGLLACRRSGSVRQSA
ncbi:hypothetical protein JXA32_11630 [Candidatus Sumerlaeota bacterium]|nr:hypothetical protein [Candidatus Sumerlaeota bacterium]